MTISIFRFATFLTTLICVNKIFGIEDTYTISELQGFPKYGENIQRTYKSEIVKKMEKNLGDLLSLSPYDTIFSNNGKDHNDQIFNNGNYDLTETVPNFVIETGIPHFRSTDSVINESNPLFSQKKFRTFDNFGNNNEYLFYDWGPNPKIWGSVKQREKENGRIITPKMSKYLSTRDRGGYGWHSNQNLWGKRRESTSIGKKINRTPYDSIADTIGRNHNLIPLRSFDVVPVMENKINLDQSDERKPQLGHVNPILSRDSDILWDSRERRGKLEDDPRFLNEESERSVQTNFPNEIQNLLLDQRPIKPSDEKTIRGNKFIKILCLFQKFLNNKQGHPEHYYFKPQHLRNSANFEGFRGKKGIDKLFQNLGNLSGTFFTPRG
ncbi:UNVERIFIED_CONTAM: hypothetical protein RMT77_005242 [Armadillidium vulgare]